MYCTNYSIYDKNCLDCLNIHYCENCYFCTDVKKSNDCQYLYNCAECYKCSFCNDCNGCNNCFLCYNLRNKSFCIENKQYSKDEYHKIINERNIDDPMKLFHDVLNKLLYKNVIIEQSENCT